MKRVVLSSQSVGGHPVGRAQRRYAAGGITRAHRLPLGPGEAVISASASIFLLLLLRLILGQLPPLWSFVVVVVVVTLSLTLANDGKLYKLLPRLFFFLLVLMSLLSTIVCLIDATTSTATFPPRRAATSSPKQLRLVTSRMLRTRAASTRPRVRHCLRPFSSGWIGSHDCSVNNNRRLRN